jgi:hypothetical protein
MRTGDRYYLLYRGGETRGALNFLKLEKIQRDESGGFEKIY